MAQKSFFKFLPLVLICTLAFAEEDVKAKQRFSVYMHPASLYGLILLIENNVFFYFTAEYKLNDFYSIVLAPSIWNGKWIEPLVDNRRKYFRLGSAIGIRRFVNGNAEGFYTQLMPGAYYLSYEESEAYMGKTVSGPMIDVLGYVGYARKFFGFDTFVETGIGYRWSSLSNPFEDIPFPLSSGYENMALNVNIGVGLSLF